MTEVQKVEFPAILNVVDVVYVLHSNIRFINYKVLSKSLNGV